MKRGGFIKRKKPLQSKSAGSLSRRTMLATLGKSDTAKTKQRIQALLRSIVIKRDGCCILKNIRHCTDTVLQADHLITRANSATYGDSRLVVCVCRSCHAWKSLGSNMHKAQYDFMVSELLPPDRVALWDRCEKESWRPHPMRENDWLLVEAALQAELRILA